MVKVKMLVGMAGAVTLSPGDLHECDAPEAARLIEAGYAEATAQQVETTTKPAPRAKRKG